MPVRIGEDAGGIRRVEFDRPERLNALDLGHLDGLYEALRSVAADGEARVLVFEGRGTAFCVGSDIQELAGPGVRPRAGARFREVAALLAELEIPVVAKLHGLVLGRGLQLALLADLRYAARTAQFGFPDVEVGLGPGGGVTHVLPRLVGRGRAAQLLLTGEILDARAAAKIGLVTRLTADHELEGAVAAAAARMAKAPRAALRATKRLLRGAFDEDLAAHLAREAELEAAAGDDPETAGKLAGFSGGGAQ